MKFTIEGDTHEIVSLMARLAPTAGDVSVGWIRPDEMSRDKISSAPEDGVGLADMLGRQRKIMEAEFAGYRAKLEAEFSAMKSRLMGEHPANTLNQNSNPSKTYSGQAATNGDFAGVSIDMPQPMTRIGIERIDVERAVAEQEAENGKTRKARATKAEMEARRAAAGEPAAAPPAPTSSAPPPVVEERKPVELPHSEAPVEAAEGSYTLDTMKSMLSKVVSAKGAAEAQKLIRENANGAMRLTEVPPENMSALYRAFELAAA